MPDIVTRDALDITQPQGKHRLRSLKSLTLALRIHAKHDRILRRVEIETYTIAELLDEERVR